jgi:hypothetical protein
MSLKFGIIRKKLRKCSLVVSWMKSFLRLLQRWSNPIAGSVAVLVYFLVLRWPIIKLIQSLQRPVTRYLANKTAPTEKDPSALLVQ